LSLWVLGTDTGVGKTAVSALLMARYRQQPGIAYWKPIATGAGKAQSPVAPGIAGRAMSGASAVSGDRSTVMALAGAGVETLPEVYHFTDPVSPHLAARRAGSRIEQRALLSALEGHHAAGKRLVIEGIGGVLVPLDDAGTLLADVVASSNLPAVVVARSTLGTINHTLLTLEALGRRQVPVLGVVLNGPSEDDNRGAIRRQGGVSVLAELPEMAPFDAAACATEAACLDPDGVLASWLGGHR